MENDTKAAASKDKHNTGKANATWNRTDKATLVRTLMKAKEDGKWGDNNPKEAAWSACVAALAGSEKGNGEGTKTIMVV